MRMTDGMCWTSSALRLAEEYESAFGRSALIDVVRQEISDDDFEPSILHEKLVDLPWADIFTTNYDRLIERAALNSAGRSLRRFSYEIGIVHRMRFSSNRMKTRTLENHSMPTNSAGSRPY